MTLDCWLLYATIDDIVAVTLVIGFYLVVMLAVWRQH